MEDKIMLPILRTSWPNLVDELLKNDFWGNFVEEHSGISSPAVNIVEGKEDFRIEVAAPGLDKNDFKVNLENNVLTVSSEKERSKEEKDEKCMRKEFEYSSFKRSFTLPDTIDSDKISASHSNGILYITIPKREEAKVKPARQIAVA